MLTFFPHAPLSELQKQAADDVAAWRSFRTNHPAFDDCDRDSLESMKRSRDATIRFLQSDDQQVRLAAISLVAVYWLGHESFAEHVLRLAFADRSSQVRGGAITALLQNGAFIDDPTGALAAILRSVFPDLASVDWDAMFARIESGNREVEAAKKGAWLRIAGKCADVMQRDRQATLRYLQDSNPQVRQAALLALEMYWTEPADLFNICRQVMENDSDPQVVSLAICFMSKSCDDRDNQAICATLAQYTCDTRRPTKVRETAYFAIRNLRGLPAGPLLSLAAKTFRFPDDVDWALVEDCLDS